jgi:hypothetical protein
VPPQNCGAPSKPDRVVGLREENALLSCGRAKRSRRCRGGADVADLHAAGSRTDRGVAGPDDAGGDDVDRSVAGGWGVHGCGHLGADRLSSGRLPDVDVQQWPPRLARRAPRCRYRQAGCPMASPTSRASARRPRAYAGRARPHSWRLEAVREARKGVATGFAEDSAERTMSSEAHAPSPPVAVDITPPKRPWTSPSTTNLRSARVGRQQEPSHAQTRPLIS